MMSLHTSFILIMSFKVLLYFLIYIFQLSNSSKIINDPKNITSSSWWPFWSSQPEEKESIPSSSVGWDRWGSSSSLQEITESPKVISNSKSSWDWIKFWSSSKTDLEDSIPTVPERPSSWKFWESSSSGDAKNPNKPHKKEIVGDPLKAVTPSNWVAQIKSFYSSSSYFGQSPVASKVIVKQTGWSKVKSWLGSTWPFKGKSFGKSDTSEEKVDEGEKRGFWDSTAAGLFGEKERFSWWNYAKSFLPSGKFTDFGKKEEEFGVVPSTIMKSFWKRIVG